MCKYPLPMEALEETIGYVYRDKSLLRQALTHSSSSNETDGKNHHLECNERLEFLGDSVLSVITSEYLFTHFKDCPEGDLTRMRAGVVCERALTSYATEIGLGNYLRLGRGEERNGGRECKSIIADAFEALLASMYLDGGRAQAEKFLLPLIAAELSGFKPGGFHGDCKTKLQQFVQQNEGDFLEYVTVGESGPDHKKIFTIEARLNGNVIGRGEGGNKRSAEQAAAHMALELFGLAEE